LSRAFITGVSGFAGRNLARRLVERGDTVAGTVQTRSSGVDGVAEHAVDIQDVKVLDELLGSFRPDVVYHLAAIVDTVTTPSVMRLHEVNTMGTVAVTEAMRAAAPDARLLFTSSSFAYGGAGADELPVKESQPLRPVTPYGASKAASEDIVWQVARQTGAEVIVTRAFQHTGPGHTGEYAMADWARQLAEIERAGGPGTIHCGNLDVERDYLDVRDVASAYAAAATSGTAGGTYNVCSQVPRTMRSLLEGLIAAFGVDATIEVDQARLRRVDQPSFYGDRSALQADTGWEPSIPIESTLADLAETTRLAFER
jgi:GDP-4-dehydro-6-deoxy-D-mannose reductase